MPATDPTFVREFRRLLWFELHHASDGTVKIRSYHRVPSDVGHQLALGRKLLPSDISALFEEAILDLGETFWKSRVASTDRIIAQIAERKTLRFAIRYYSIGVDSIGSKTSGTPVKTRLASCFIFDAEGTQPELPGFFDWQSPTQAQNVEEFFDLSSYFSAESIRKDSTGSTFKDRWCKSQGCFETIWRCAILFRRSVAGGKEYIGLDVTAELHDYPLGRLLGGLPFGAESKFLAICKVDKDNPEPWIEALKRHAELFGAWNVICTTRSKLRRIFIEGAPGSGKELWVDAIREGSRPHRSGKWKTLAATLPMKELKSLLYGESSGALERSGFLALCADGGVFIDEIGKSRPEFRRDLLRVLEAEEFVPTGGIPTPTKNVLFVFASTPTDRIGASDPPDFWTRMDVVLSLPRPITIIPPPKWRGRSSPFDSYDEARFHALFGKFWLDALREQLTDKFGEPDALLENFTRDVLNPIVKLIAVEALKGPWPRKCIDGIPLSPRRVKSLAATIASEYRWLGYPVEDPDLLPNAPKRKTGEQEFEELRMQFVHDFFIHLVQDEKNRIDAEESTKPGRPPIPSWLRWTGL